MSLLIDGYNLLYAAGITGQGRGPGYFERSRLALLNFLVEAIDPQELPRTIVVFDAGEAPPGLPHSITHRGLAVRFAAKHSDADELIEELILADTSPRKLTVVSSDHRLQRAAHRRRAKAIDSDLWYAEANRRRFDRGKERRPEPIKPVPESTQSEVDYWIREFGGEDLPGGNADNIFPPGYAEDEPDHG